MRPADVHRKIASDRRKRRIAYLQKRRPGTLRIAFLVAADSIATAWGGIAHAAQSAMEANQRIEAERARHE